MPKNIFFSVVIPTYNASDFIRETLESVRLQTFNDYEIILVNDGSCDNTLEVVQKYFAEHPFLNHVIVNQSNKGIGGARNSAIKVAKGEFIAFLDADDKWHKDKLLKVKEYYDRCPDIDLICHNENLVKNGKIIKKLKYGPYKTYGELLFKGNCLSTSATTARRNKLLEAGLFSENLDFNSVEDYELWLRLSKICDFGYLNNVLGEYVVDKAGITSNMQKHTENTFNVLDYHFLQHKKSLWYKYLMRKRRAEVMRSGSYALLGANQFKESLDFLHRAFRLNPFSIKIWLTWIIFYIKRCLTNED